MPSPLRQAALNLGERLDEDLIPALISAASLDASEVREALDATGLAWHDPARGRTAAVAELDASAAQVLRRSVNQATLRGGLAGLAGFAAIPPEAVAALVQLLHLAQRLAIIYGHDPDTDRGRVWLVRALAGAMEVELPRQGRWDLRLSHLKDAMLQANAEGPDRSAWLARTLTLRAAGTLGARLTRLIPGLSSGISAASARRTLRRQGQRMISVYQRSWEGALLLEGPVEDAIEVP